MNIKDIALKVAKQMRESVYPNPYISEAAAIDFAEALVAELAKENEPVAWYDGNKFYANEESASMGCADMSNLKPVFTLPPTAEQIEQETAEACAKACEAKHFSEDLWDGEHQMVSNCFTQEDCTKAIRNGAWKEFK